MRVENGSEGQQRRLLCNRRPIQVYSGSGSGYHIPGCALEALSRSPSWPSRSIPYLIVDGQLNTITGWMTRRLAPGGWGLTAFATTADHFSVAFSTKWRGDGVDLPLPSCLSLFAREHLSLPTYKRWYQQSRGRGVPSAVHDKWKLRIEPINRDCELKN